MPKTKLTVEEVTGNLFSTKEAAEVLKISLQQIRNLIRHKSIPVAFIASSRIFLLKYDVYQYAREHRIVGNGKDLSRSIDRYVDDETFEQATLRDRKEVRDFVKKNYVTVLDAFREYGIEANRLSYCISNELITPAFRKGKTVFLDRKEIERNLLQSSKPHKVTSSQVVLLSKKPVVRKTKKAVVG